MINRYAWIVFTDRIKGKNDTNNFYYLNSKISQIINMAQTSSRRLSFSRKSIFCDIIT